MPRIGCADFWGPEVAVAAARRGATAAAGVAAAGMAPELPSQGVPNKWPVTRNGVLLVRTVVHGKCPGIEYNATQIASRALLY